MIRQTVRSAALAAAGLLLAGGAFGQDAVLRQSSSNAALIAAEYFGGEARMVQVSNMDLDSVTAGTQRPYVGLTLSGATVTDGNTADITFTLAGATFDQPASPTNLDQRPDAGCSGDKGNVLEATVMDGGERGDTSVTYRVEVTDTGTDDLAIGQQICFWVPDLSVTLATVSAPGTTPPVRGVNVTATAIAPVATTGTPFPTRISGMTDMDADMNGTIEGSEIGNAPNMDVRILQAANALAASLGMGDTAYVAIADRTKIARGGTRDPSAAPAGAAMGLMVGTLSVSISQADIWELDGSGLLPKDQLDGSLSGQIKMSVGGRYQSGDRLIVGSGPTALRGTIDGMTADVTLQTEVTGGMPIVYVPGGVDVLKPAKFSVGAAYLFNDRRNYNAMITPMSMGEIKYAGVEVEGYAYGVVRGGGTDTSYVRVTCEDTDNCHIFADCAAQDGTEYFGGPVTVAAGTTGVVDSDTIAAALEGGWTEGRGRCDLHSTGDLSVQHMVRRGHTLINSSVVVGRGLDESRDDRIAVIDTVVDNICASIEGHLGRTGDLDGPDNDATTLGDNISAHMPTMCRNAKATTIADDFDTNGDPSDDNSNPNGF